MDIVLTFCPVKGQVNYPPLGLAYLSAVLKQHNISHKILDLNNTLYKENRALASDLYSFFGPITFDLETVNNIDNPESLVSNIDTIYNFNLLLYALAYPVLKKVSEEERIFIEQLHHYIDSEVLRIEEMRPKVVGFSVYISNVAVSCLIAQKLKNRNKGIKVIFGGPSNHYEQNREFFLKSGIVEYLLVKVRIQLLNILIILKAIMTHSKDIFRIRKSILIHFHFLILVVLTLKITQQIRPTATPSLYR